MLGFYHRLVVVDAARQVVIVERDLMWLLRKRRSISFSHITGITYGYQDGILRLPAWSARDSNDIFKVGLLLANGESVGLFRFSGNGTFGNDGVLPDWCYLLHFALDCSGTQESESFLFAKLLSQMIHAPIRPPAYDAT